MLTLPTISDYKPFYVQFSSGNALDIMTQYYVVVRGRDYQMANKVKEPYKNQWKDEHGDDEFIPSTGLYIEAFTFKLECAMFAKPTTGTSAKNEREVLNKGIRDFEAALRGGSFKVYDDWTGYGFQNVRLQEFPNPSQDAYDVVCGMARVMFTVTFKVNDPVTHMKKSGNNIVEG